MQNRDVSWVVFAVAAVDLALGSLGAARGQSSLPPTSNRTGEAERVPLVPGEINIAASRVYVFVDKTGFGHQHAVEGRLREGGLRITGRSAGRMVFDMQSFRADTLGARRYVGLKGEIDAKTQQDVTTTMTGADILDVQRFPTATFDVASLRELETRGKSGKAQYRLEGEFTLHGTKRPLRFVADGTAERGHVHFKGSFRLRQTDFKIPPYKKALGAVGVADVLTVYGDIWIKQ